MFNFWMHVLLAVCGASFGILSSAGVFTVLASVGLVPRFAGKMHVARHIFALEEAVVSERSQGDVPVCFISP